MGKPCGRFAPLQLGLGNTILQLRKDPEQQQISQDEGGESLAKVLHTDRTRRL